MKIAYLRTSARGIETVMKKNPEQVTNDQRATFSFFERDGEVFIYVSTLSKHDRTPQREKEVMEKVMASINAKKQEEVEVEEVEEVTEVEETEVVEEVEEFEGDETILNKLPKHAQHKILDIYKDMDGYWIYLKKGYYFVSSEGTTEHALNLAELNKMVTKQNIREL